ncbi:NUDIX hydrolase [Paenisporosarcina antarctica]|uniref:NUDIX hydrolase n=1 Tax=Paenisporosarcina antarctica TaxID=417367 RepID=A0A4P6ZYT5_9BACL|nr:NUDIX hydrolase [Paenisporosarcina antarctica]QBP41388.1 NUDIX hydrolase [Paenisporosarcina antarctica]
MKKYEEKSISTTPIYDGKVISLRVDEVTLPNGKTSKRELIKHPGAVAIIPITAEGKLVFVEQYRKALERSLIETPAGKLEPGEQPEITARRELEEETGYACGKLTHIQSFATSPGFANEIIHVFVAEELSKIENAAALDEDEFVEVVEATIEEAEEMMKNGQIFDAKTAYSVLWAKEYLQKR